MATTRKSVTDGDDKTFRMSNDPLRNPDGDYLPNTSGNIVTFEVGYGKDFKGTKFMKEGEKHQLHVLHAKHLEETGQGKILGDK